MPRMQHLILAALLIMPLSSLAAADTAEGARLYKRCAACHLPTGAGVPGAFPPINNDRLGVFYETKEGRSYLTLVLAKGLSGAIDVDGVTYRGVMPAQHRALKDEGIADVLNYLLITFQQKGETRQKFSTEEVKQILSTHSTVKARDLSKQRQSLQSMGDGAP